MKRSSSTGKPSPEGKEPQSMDPSITEQRVGAPRSNNQRVCWAIKTLNEEVWNLFPETPVEYSEVNGRNTSLGVTYDLTPLDEETDRIDLPNLLSLIAGDSRVSTISISKDYEGHPEYVLVVMNSDPRTQDKRDSFGFADAYYVLNEDGSDTLTDDTDGGDADSTSDDEMDGGGS